MTKQIDKLRYPLRRKIGLYCNIVTKRVKGTFETWKISDVKLVIEKEMGDKSFELPEARWSYNGIWGPVSGFFVNRNDEDTRLALILPKGGTAKYAAKYAKYIHAYEQHSGKNVVMAVPCPYLYGNLHKNIVSMYERKTDMRLHKISGGLIEVSKRPFSDLELTLFDYSRDYGKADHKKVAELLSSYGLNAKWRK